MTVLSNKQVNKMSNIDLKIYMFNQEEERWANGVIRNQFPKWLTNIAERRRFAFLQFFLVWQKKYRIERVEHTEIVGNMSKGFRTGCRPTKIKSIISTIYKNNKKLESKEFKVNIISPMKI